VNPVQKLRYELDPHNRFVLDKPGGKSELRKFRRVIDGRFKVDRRNELSCHIKSPVAEETIPHQLKLRGKWSLTDNHNLRLTLDKQGRETFGDKITLQGEILDVKRNSLLFAITTKTKEDTKSIYVLNLSGSWKADRNNRLSFHIKKEKGRHDILTFKGAWEINKNHRIIYRYEKASLIRKRKKIHTLTFKGHWDIKKKLRISYVLERNTDSVFDFSARGGSAYGGKASAGIFKDGYIKYELGIGLANRINPVRKTIILYGTWRLKKDVGLLFEVKYEDKKMHAIVFGAEVKLTGKDRISFRLKNDIGNKDLGVKLELSHKILKGDGRAFLQLLKSKRESAIYTGAAWRW
jgi:hypothetical protein